MPAAKQHLGDGVGGRGAFYDPVGALKDVGQNHMLSMLAVVAMDRPAEFSGPAVSRERARVIARLAKLTKRTIGQQVVRGQYEGYTGENGVKNDSQTETYFRIQCFIDSARWRGVPICISVLGAVSAMRCDRCWPFASTKLKVRGAARPTTCAVKWTTLMCESAPVAAIKMSRPSSSK